MTSQIFANIYLNEFDRFMRHQIKPLGYVRYGDDFMAFFSTQKDARNAQVLASEWLNNNLNLSVHKKNNIIFRVKQGSKFLGHQIYPSSNITAEKRLLLSLPKELNRNNISSYKSMHLPERYRRDLDWVIKNKL